MKLITFQNKLIQRISQDPTSLNPSLTEFDKVAFQYNDPSWEQPKPYFKRMYLNEE